MSIKKKKKKREKKRGADRRISRYTNECGLHHTSRSPYVAWVACLHEWPFGASVITCSRNNERLILSSYYHSRLLSSSVATYRPFVLCCPFNRSWHTVLWFALPHTLYTIYFFFSLSLSPLLPYYFFHLLFLLPSLSLFSFFLFFCFSCLLFPLPIVGPRNNISSSREGRNNRSIPLPALHLRCTLHPRFPLLPPLGGDKDLDRTGEAWEAEASSRRVRILFLSLHVPQTFWQPPTNN